MVAIADIFGETVNMKAPNSTANTIALVLPPLCNSWIKFSVTVVCSPQYVLIQTVAGWGKYPNYCTIATCSFQWCFHVFF